MIETFLVDKEEFLESCAKHRFSTDGQIALLATEREVVVFYSTIAGALQTEIMTDVNVHDIVLNKARCNPIIPSSPAMLEVIKQFESNEIQVSFEYQNDVQIKIRIEDESNSIVITL